jgi:hypothetical protein
MANKAKTPLAALDAFRFDSDAGDNLTPREWLCDLLLTLWHDGEGFSGKRPWGNSGWETDIYKPLAQHGFIKATLTPWGDKPDEVDVDMTQGEKAGAERFVEQMIVAAFIKKQTATLDVSP